MTTSLSWFGNALLLALIASCGREAIQTEVGTGSDSFVSFVEGATLNVVCGPQGGQHIWTAIRVRGLDRDAAHVSLRIRFDDGSSSNVVCGQQLAGVTLEARDGWFETAGVICYIPDPDAVHDKRLRMEGTVTDRFGESASASASFIAHRPTGSCGRQ